MKTINIETVENIEKKAFEGCTNLKGIYTSNLLMAEKIRKVLSEEQQNKVKVYYKGKNGYIEI